jgi:toxin ParE1/3/4
MFRLTKKAYEDLKSIAIYTEEKWDKNQCILYLTMLDSAFHEIAKNPDSGIKIDDIRKGYFKYRAGKHFVFYHQTKSTVKIVRILHQMMDIESKLK